MRDHDERADGAGDEVEMHVEEVREPGGDAGDAGATPVSPRRNRFRALRLALYAIAFVAVLVAIIAAIVRPQIGGIGGLAYPTPTLAQQTPAEIGSAPLTCTPSTPSRYTSKLGGTPVWVSGFQASMKGQATTNVGHSPYTRYGWKARIGFSVEPGATGLINVHGERLSDGSPLWISVSDARETNFGQRAPSVRVVLNPQEPGLPDYEDTGWAAWGGVLYIPAAGCYALDASWPGGSWRVTFAAGE
ncbi:MAG TPA: hypothetical protein VF739_02925 [Ktedonobacterales bacterium]